MKTVIETNRIAFEQDGRVLAEVTFPALGERSVQIDRTFVDSSLRGQGIAGKLMKLAADEIRRQGKRAKPTCSYAVAWFEKHASEQDLLV